MGEGKLGQVAKTQGWGFISWDLLGNMRSTGTNGGGGSVCPHSFYLGPWVPGRLSPWADTSLFSTLQIKCPLGGKSSSVYCSLLGRFNARVSRKWEVRVRLIGGWRGGQKGLWERRQPLCVKGIIGSTCTGGQGGPQEWGCKAAAHTLHRDQFLYM